MWVTGAGDGLPRAGVAISLHDAKGRVVARASTDSSGIARLTGSRPPTPDSAHGRRERSHGIRRLRERGAGNRPGLALDINDYDPDLNPWRFNVSAGMGRARDCRLRRAVFTERGIYRPGEPLFAKAIVRPGPARRAPEVPAPGDSLRWLFESRRDAGEEAGPLPAIPP